MVIWPCLEQSGTIHSDFLEEN